MVPSLLLAVTMVLFGSALLLVAALTLALSTTLRAADPGSDAAATTVPPGHMQKL